MEKTVENYCSAERKTEGFVRIKSLCSTVLLDGRPQDTVLIAHVVTNSDGIHECKIGIQGSAPDLLEVILQTLEAMKITPEAFARMAKCEAFAHNVTEKEHTSYSTPHRNDKN